MTTIADLEYTKCAYCDFFVEVNPAKDDDEGIAEYIHLDDGEKEHDHDAVPSTETHTLDGWDEINPQLFTMFSDGKIGPNSEFYGKKVCQYSLAHVMAGIIATTEIEVPIMGTIPVCVVCADFYARMK